MNRGALLAGVGVAVLALCGGCRGVASGDRTTSPGDDQVAVTAPPVAGATRSSGSGGSADQLQSQWNDIRTSLNNIRSQLSADATP